MLKTEKMEYENYFFQILWKSRLNILVSFPSHLKKLRFTRFTREKTPQNNFSHQNFSVENNYFLMISLLFCPRRMLYSIAKNLVSHDVIGNYLKNPIRK